MSSTVVVKPKVQGVAPTIDAGKIEQVLIRGDLAGLSEAQRLSYYKQVCETVGLNHLTRPFDYIVLNGKLVLYANKGCAEQLRMIHKISIRITDRKTIDGVYVVTAAAQFPDGRIDESTGAVMISNLKGNDLANAVMKAETKAKRRVTLSACGLNMLDETEAQDVPKSAQGRVVIDKDEIAGNGVISDEFIIPYGPPNLCRKPISKADPVALREYIVEMEEKIKKSKIHKGKNPPWFNELLKHAEPIIAAYENGSSEPEWDEENS